MNPALPEPPRGVLSPPEEAEGIDYLRIAPRAALAPFLAHFWMVRWDRRGLQPFGAETLPHPCVQLLFEAGRAQVAGVQTRLFRRRLVGQGRVFGVKFRPACFQPFFRASVSGLKDRVVSLRSVLGPASDAWRDALREEADARRCVALSEAFLEERLPPLPDWTAQLRDLVERLAREGTIHRVAQAAALGGVELRSLQRRFNAAVGVSPKWVLQRYRLHQAAERLAQPLPVEFGSLALELGYFDQSHFTRGFQAVIGRAPGQHRRRRRGA